MKNSQFQNSGFFKPSKTWGSWIGYLILIGILYGIFHWIDRKSHSASDTLRNFIILSLPVIGIFFGINQEIHKKISKNSNSNPGQ